MCDKDSIHPMFLKSSYSAEQGLDIQPGNVTSKIISAKLIPKTAAEKYNKGVVEAKKCVQVMAESGDAQFSIRYEALKMLFRIWASGNEADIRPVSSSSKAPLEKGICTSIELILGCTLHLNHEAVNLKMLPGILKMFL